MILDDPEFNPYAFPPKPAAETAGRGSGLDRLESASFWERTLACLIDIACACALIILGFTALAILGSNDKQIEHMIVNEMDFLVLALPVSVWLTYVVAMQFSPFRASLGKLALGLRVRTSCGGRASVARIVAREVLKYPCLSFHVITHGAELPFVRYDKSVLPLYLHDLLTRTRVFRVKIRTR